jgi:hypothetical protein
LPSLNIHQEKNHLLVMPPLDGIIEWLHKVFLKLQGENDVDHKSTFCQSPNQKPEAFHHTEFSKIPVNILAADLLHLESLQS